MSLVSSFNSLLVHCSKKHLSIICLQCKSARQNINFPSAEGRQMLRICFNGIVIIQVFTTFEYDPIQCRKRRIRFFHCKLNPNLILLL